MKERLIQLGFDEQTLAITWHDVTPPGFSGLTFPITRPKAPLSRFVREAGAPYQVTSPTQAADYLIRHIYTPFSDFDQEEMWVLLLNTKGWITHEVMVYRGTVNAAYVAAYVRPAELLKEAVRVNMPSLILSHCHPSGVPEPSPEDIQITRKAIEGAEILGLEILDHIIVGRGQWVSLKEKGGVFCE